MEFLSYAADPFFDEFFLGPDRPRPGAIPLLKRIRELPTDELQRRQRAAEAALYQAGITFNVYSDTAGQERIFPFDIIPRIVEAPDWNRIESGLKQRIHALNIFLNDVYGEQRILKDKVIPEDLVRSGTSFRPACRELKPPRGIWCHVTGTDLVRDRDGTLYVLEDNLRCPSGVSYVLENRRVLKSTFPLLFNTLPIRTVDDYPNRLIDTLASITPGLAGTRTAVVLTPGVYNSAYFEHSFLARKMGTTLVEGRDLIVVDDQVFMRTTRGLERVEAIYRRIDDDFLDPEVFRSDSLLGVPGLIRAYQKGNVSLANAPGTGIADDKAIYAYVPEIIRYYLQEDPILPNVPTFVCWKEQERRHVLQNLDQLVVKSVNESGGYGMLIGPHASAEEREHFAGLIQANPRSFIAQPTLALSSAPCLIDGQLQPRHVDLRPYILYGEDIYVLPGGLTRVALRKGSLVVNSSQGGGSKDTWVLAEGD